MRRFMNLSLIAATGLLIACGDEGGGAGTSGASGTGGTSGTGPDVPCTPLQDGASDVVIGTRAA